MRLSFKEINCRKLDTTIISEKNSMEYYQIEKGIYAFFWILTLIVVHKLTKSDCDNRELELRSYYMPSEEFDRWNKLRLAELADKKRRLEKLKFWKKWLN